MRYLKHIFIETKKLKVKNTNIKYEKCLQASGAVPMPPNIANFHAAAGNIAPSTGHVDGSWVQFAHGQVGNFSAA